MRTPRLVVAPVYVALACLCLAACGDQGPDRPADRAGTPSASSSGSGTEDPVEDLTVVPPGKPGARLEISGTVAPGVEGGCHLLSTGGTTYQLVGRLHGVVDGRRVTVLGTVRPDLATTCQQGVPFVVERLVRD